MGAQLNTDLTASHKLNLKFDNVVKKLAPGPKGKQKWWVYVLSMNSRQVKKEVTKEGSMIWVPDPHPHLYIGFTGDLQSRMLQHKSGQGGLCGSNKIPTFQQLPVWLIGAIELPTKEVAIVYEDYLHKLMFGVEKPLKKDDLPNTFYKKSLTVKEQLMLENVRSWPPNVAVRYELLREHTVKFNFAGRSSKMNDPDDGRKKITMLVPQRYPVWAAQYIKTSYRCGCSGAPEERD